MHILRDRWLWALVLSFSVVVTSSLSLPAQIDTPTFVIDEPAVVPVLAEARSPFHVAVLEAARNRRQAGELSRRDMIRLRVAMLSPAFREAAKDLATIQVSASGSDNVPTDAAGQFDPSQIEWDSLIPFLEKLIEFLLQLILIFTGAP